MSSPEIRVGIEIRQMTGPRTGIGNYSLQLIRELCKYPDLSFVGFSHTNWSSVGFKDLLAIEQAAEPQPSIKRTRITHFATRSSALKSAYRRAHGAAFRFTVVRQKLDVFHALNFIPPADPKAAVLPVVYDASFIRYPETHPKERLRWLDHLAKTIAEAPYVQTISEFSRREIASIYNYPTERIIVAPPAANSIFRPHGAQATQQALLQFDLRFKSYLLAVGTLEPRKNLSTIISAFARVPPHERNNAPLVIAGGIGWGNLELPKEASSLEREGSLRFTGFISDSQLRSLYEGAIALMFPSRYEGFGMPIVEAMSCGTPVIHSKGSSMGEITADLGIQIEALDVEAWSNAIKYAIEGSPTQIKFRETELIRQAENFSWAESAKRVRQMLVSIRTPQISKLPSA